MNRVRADDEVRQIDGRCHCYEPSPNQRRLRMRMQCEPHCMPSIVAG